MKRPALCAVIFEGPRTSDIIELLAEELLQDVCLHATSSMGRIPVQAERRRSGIDEPIVAMATVPLTCRHEEGKRDPNATHYFSFAVIAFDARMSHDLAVMAHPDVCLVDTPPASG